MEQQSNNGENLLDYIETKNGILHYGIIDFITTKHVYLFDFSKDESPDYILMAAYWKMTNSVTRFSVFCIIEYPNIRLPRVVLIPKSNIKATNAVLTPTKKPKQRNFTIKDIIN